jgi:DUF1680 family protein
MNRRRFLFSAAVLPITAHAVTSAAADPTSQARPLPSPAGSRSDQPMRSRYNLTLDRVLDGTGPAYTPEFLLEDINATPGRRFTNFSGDVSGRWIGALAAASSAYGQSFPVLDDVVHSVIALQKPEGYFGKTFHFDHPDDNDLALLWGNGRLLIGLMEYYALKPDPAVLASAKKLGDFLLRIAPQFNSQQMADEFGAAHFASSYICWTQQTEGLAALYAATKDVRYRDLCAAISERMQRRPADHVHGYLCSLRGTVDLYTATGDKAHLQRVETAWTDIMQSGDVLLTGGVPEAWTPKKQRTEGCAECDWLRLNLSLWQTTGDNKYLDLAEHILFNEFAMNQFSTGDFGHARLNDLGVPATVYVRAWWCCTLHGLRAFPDVHRAAFRVAENSLFYDLPVDSSFETSNITANATSRLAEDGTVHIRIAKATAGHSLTFRKPSWADTLSLSKNGSPLAGLTVTALKTGDTITAKYAMSFAAKPAGASPKLAQLKTFSYGPWLLGIPSEANPGYFNELHPHNLLLTDTAKSAPETKRSPYAVPIAATTVAYTPAEFPDQPAQVHLRAIAEQTAVLPTEWELAFLTPKSTPHS